VEVAMTDNYCHYYRCHRYNYVTARTVTEGRYASIWRG